MIYKEITMEERNSDVWFDKNKDGNFAITIMYSVSENSSPRFLSGGPFKPDTLWRRLEVILNSIEQERMVCLSAHFINPKNVICVKVSPYKPSNERARTEDGEFYN